MYVYVYMYMYISLYVYIYIYAYIYIYIYTYPYCRVESWDGTGTGSRSSPSRGDARFRSTGWSTPFSGLVPIPSSVGKRGSSVKPVSQDVGGTNRGCFATGFRL